MMSTEVIVCPHCHQEIPLTEALSHQISEKLHLEFEQKTKEKEKQLKQVEKTLREEQQKLEEDKKSLDEQVNEKVLLLKKQIEKEAAAKVLESVAVELEDLKRHVLEKEEKLKSSQEQELELRQKARALEEEKKDIERKINIRIEEERDKLNAEANKKIDELQASLVEKEKAFVEKELALTTKIEEEKAKFAEEASKRIQEAKDAVQAKEKALQDKEYTLAAKIEEEVSQKLKIERERLELTFEGEYQTKLDDMQSQIEEKKDKLKEAREAELELRKKNRELEEQKETLDLEMRRKLDEERAKIRQDAINQLTDEYKLKDREKEEQLQRMREQIDELKKKSEQGSQQLQGEALELELKDVLKYHFSGDEISQVQKGASGADVLQRVRSRNGRECGLILWEAKRTKNWSNDWIPKLKEDQMREKAAVAILVTMTLPKDIRNFALRDGVWVTDFASFIGLAAAVREGLIEVAMAKMASEDKQDKMEVLFQYLSGSEFKQRVEAIIEVFSSLQNDLYQEKRAMERIWAKREKQILRVISNTSGMYGDLQGIIGSSLPEMEILDLKALPAATSEFTDAPV